MGISLKIVRTYDQDLIKSTITELWDDIGEDGAKNPDINVDNNCWLKIEHYGLYVIKPINAITLEIHAFMLKKHRKKQSKNSGLAVLKWIVENLKQYEKVNAEVPFIHENVKKFCLSVGFEVEGINRMSHIKGGVICDQWILGITKKEIKEVLNGMD